MTRRALVTGGSRGIGRAIAAALTASGCAVVIFAREQARIDDAVREGVAVMGKAVDVTDFDALAAAIVVEGPFDILVNNAGSASSAPFQKTDREAFRRMLSLHLEGAAEAMRACLPGMVEKGFGRIVNVASTGGLKGYPYVSAYVAAKHALVGLTRAVAVETARTGVTVNALCPGYTDTEMVENAASAISAKTGRPVEAAYQHFAATNPMGRLVRPDEVADAAVWLTGEGASAVTGQCIVIAGGEL